MLQTYFTQKDHGFTWVDLTNPTIEELQEAARLYSLHQTSLEDCLDPFHQPKVEKIGPVTFVILRLFEEGNIGVNTLQGITSKVALFLGEDLLVTVHRLPLPFMATVQRKWQGQAQKPAQLLYDIIIEVILSYESFLERSFDDLERMEAIVLSKKAPANLAAELHRLLRRLSIVWRVIWNSHQVIEKWGIENPIEGPFYQDLLERLERYLGLTDSMRESSKSLFNVYLSLSSYKTGEIIRILTIISVFFMPLTFIVGVYGMNFDNLPELHWSFGYAYVWFLMLSMVAGIFFWFHKRGWL